MVCSCKTPGGQGLKERTANQASLVRAGTHVEGRIRRVKFANSGGFDHFCANRGQNHRHLQTPPSRSPFAGGPFRETAVEGGPRSRSGHSSGRRRPSSRPPSRLHLCLRPATPSRPAPKRHSSSRTERPSSRYAGTYVSTSPIAFFGRAFLISPRGSFSRIQDAPRAIIPDTLLSYRSHNSCSPGVIHFSERVFDAMLHFYERLSRDFRIFMSESEAKRLCLTDTPVKCSQH